MSILFDSIRALGFALLHPLTLTDADLIPIYHADYGPETIEKFLFGIVDKQKLRAVARLLTSNLARLLMNTIQWVRNVLFARLIH